MKKYVLILMSVLSSAIGVRAQNTANLIIFSEDGDPFYAFVNGVKQNNKPETNVKVTGLSPNISLRIEFENKILPQIKQVMNLESGLEHTARIKRDMKKQLKLRYFGSVPMSEASTGMTTVEYHSSNNEPESATGDPVTENYAISSGAGINTGGGNNNTIVTSKTVTTTKSSTSNRDPENVSINMNMAGVGLNMNVSGTGMDNDAQVNTTTSTTVTQSSSYSHSSTGNTQRNEPTSKPAYNSAATKTGCSIATSPANFAKIKQAVEAKPFSDTKMSTAKIATKGSCLSVNQVKEICKLFAMDNDKLEYAKFAYDYCVDKTNYYEVSEIFSFSSTTDDFNKFLEK